MFTLNMVNNSILAGSCCFLVHAIDWDIRILEYSVGGISAERRYNFSDTGFDSTIHNIRAYLAASSS